MTNVQRLQVANLLLALCVAGLGGWYLAMMLRTGFGEPARVETKSEPVSVLTKSFDPLALARIFRSDLPSAFNSVRQSKAGPTDHERVSFAGLEEALRQMMEGTPQPATDDGAAVGDSVSVDDPGANMPGKASPILARTATGEIEINDFKTLNLDSGACLDMGYALLDDLGAPRSALQVVGQTKVITIGRICTTNGSVVISCRGSQTTFSPRRPRPDDNCARS